MDPVQEASKLLERMSLVGLKRSSLGECKVGNVDHVLLRCARRFLCRVIDVQGFFILEEAQSLCCLPHKVLL